MRVLALDIGRKKIGVAISDALGITAQGLKTVFRKNPQTDFIAVKDIVDEMGVGTIVVGLPLNMDGSPGPKAQEAKEFAEGLSNFTSAPVRMWDERLTTLQATRTLLEADISRTKRKKLDDKIAAQLMLQSYLDSLTRSKEE